MEINSSFYRPHQPKTYARWAASVPANFKFAVKMPKAITHQHRLVSAESQLSQFLNEVSCLGPKLGPILIQLPPSLAFQADTVTAFLTVLRQRFTGQIVCEPRHPTWFAADAEQLFAAQQIARAAADPAVVSAAAEPGGSSSLVYYRLHGSPVKYYSPYSSAYLARLSQTLSHLTAPAWCIFDNTAAGAATDNALSLNQLYRP